MCGIVGLFLKDPKLEPQLGAMLTDMLITMTDRGPDSAGIAIYGAPDPVRAKLTVQSPHPGRDFEKNANTTDETCRRRFTAVPRGGQAGSAATRDG